MNSAAQTRVKLEIVIRNSSLETQPIVGFFFFYRFNNLPLIISVDKAKNRNTVCWSVFYIHFLWLSLHYFFRMLYSSRRDFCTCVSFIYFTPLKYPALYRKKSDIRGSTTERKIYTTANGFHQAVNLKKPTHTCLLFFLIKHQLKCTLFCWYYKECVYLQNACRPRGFEL